MDPTAPLPPCPASPNCVSSEADPSDAQHFVAPLPLPAALSPAAALAEFAALIDATPRARVLEGGELRLRAIQRTALFRFVDDIEARVDPEARLLHVRSASRLGYSDMGVNRRRVEGWLSTLARSWGMPWSP